ncbi:MAG: G5 domain-containing protein [Anaerolineaceae bacterium]|nr:G5 domain-containing protein [Anaerolineaceae bacterium]
MITVQIEVDGASKAVTISSGATVQSVLEQSGITIGNLDRITPPSQTVLTKPILVTITRVTESFEIKEQIIPFQRQTVCNESLPEGQTLLIQPGINGIQQITYRVIEEDGIETSNSIFKSVNLSEPLPEIIMVGVQTPFTAIPISGTIVYLTAGNAWIMEGTTGERKPLITTGDLDGRVFSLSPDGEWLLYTRGADEGDDYINALWALEVHRDPLKPIYMRVDNVIHFADWVPGSSIKASYSTVEPREIAPGWQANNDLQTITINPNGIVLAQREIIEANSGGIYGWWGTNFSWSNDGEYLAFTRPDSIGIIDLENGEFIDLIDLIPLQTRSDWAWVPGLGWSPDSAVLYTVNHVAMSGLSTNEISPLFDLTAITLDDNLEIPLAPQSGMFAYPVPSPKLDGNRFFIAYLQAIFPEQSETSRYRLMLMDRDGSNRQSIFPPEGAPGLEPQSIVWSKSFQEGIVPWLALIYQGNLWLIDPTTNQAKQITGDGSIGRIDWR